VEVDIGEGIAGALAGGGEHADGANLESGADLAVGDLIDDGLRFRR
jgi:hypothetical protein